MIVRIVQMTFREDEVKNFLKVFESSKDAIRSFPGVMHLELLQNKTESNILYTYSHWESEEDLEIYRKSDLFKSTWAKTKPLFKAPAKAWSNERLHHLA